MNVTAEDGNGGKDCLEYTVTVANVNDAPVVTNGDVPDAVTGDMFTMTFTADDVDGDG